MDDFEESAVDFNLERMSFSSLVQIMGNLSDIAKETGIETKFQEFMVRQRAVFNERANGDYKRAPVLMKSHFMTQHLVRTGMLYLQLYEEPELLEEQLQQLYNKPQNTKPF